MKVPSLIILLVILGTRVQGQVMFSAHSKSTLKCSACHTCEYPTAKEPCLVDCPREDLITIRHAPTSVPMTMKLDQLKNEYAGVIFSHRLHAEMYDMSGGCGGCHHYNTKGPVLVCGSCHKPVVSETDLGTPGLMAAYHRLCIGCHREWSHEIKCQSCHALKGSAAGTDGKSAAFKGHVKVSAPVKLVYHTESNEGRVVTFYHTDHSDRFGLACATCHADQACIRCHDAAKTKTAPVTDKMSGGSRTLDEKHRLCFSCHQDETCSRCHRETELAPFDHGSRTGWVLKRYHAEVACRQCHGERKQFVKVSRQCKDCHGAWSRLTFQHRQAGLVLDENHSEAECDDCHLNRDFSVPPSCANCHDDKSWPKNKPGKPVW